MMAARDEKDAVTAVWTTGGLARLSIKHVNPGGSPDTFWLRRSGRSQSCAAASHGMSLCICQPQTRSAGTVYVAPCTSNFHGCLN